MIDLMPNGTVFVQWGLFLAAFFVLNKLVFAPTLKVLDGRKEKIVNTKKRAEGLTLEAETLLSQVEDKITKARARGNQLKEEKLAEAFAQQAKVQAQVREENQLMLQKVHEKVEEEGRGASLQLKEYAQQIGLEIAEKVLERKIS
jgi:F-type H+-transporting ATPase subunit b